MIVYGKNVFETLKDSPDQILDLYVQNGARDKRIEKILSTLPKNVRLKTVSKKEMDKMTDQGVHQGIAARVKDLPMLSLDELIEAVSAKEKKTGRLPLIVALDEIQDPHNVGAILRSADASGADGVILCRHKGAGLTPAAVKTSAGAAYSVPVASVSSLAGALRKLKDHGYWVAGSDFDETSVDYRKGLYDRKLVLVIGNEGKGMSKSVKDACDFKVHIPMRGEVQSLNASVAAGILMYEAQAARQRASDVSSHKD
ncbi:23S rRNA (guanosine(2251)-2'-O)-methyltransferase RlmB [Erysipelotrichaceae bacterium 51-3]|uniref:23S rRNA (guanosine(2251)-2'-O)-methyltransferase RlmB n=1 Tax=Allobaculum sp. JKK-2023 TaxID=3108943 RepID=UPI002B05E563|nr:23S rRNA (guanosine(2251)-2'-O)-methyltransferase RlmB [Allobaculum sp. JKK-2023]